MYNVLFAGDGDISVKILVSVLYKILILCIGLVGS